MTPHPIPLPARRGEEIVGQPPESHRGPAAWRAAVLWSRPRFRASFNLGITDGMIREESQTS